VPMEVIITDTPEEIGQLGADVVAQVLASKPDAVIGLATGSSPVGIYDDLARRIREGELSLKECTAFLLDEYVGLPEGHPESYRSVIERDFVSKVDIPNDKVHSLNGRAADIPAECAAYEQAMQDAGGVDLQILGIGTDGHIAFNEPGSSLTSRTRIKTLLPQTRRDNARFFGDDLDAVPQQCLTQGVGTVLEARHLLLIANGAGKAHAIRDALEGPVTAMCTGSVVQLHPHVTVIVDEDAASLLRLTDYYREAWAAKPSWQGF